MDFFSQIHFIQKDRFGDNVRLELFFLSFSLSFFPFSPGPIPVLVSKDGRNSHLHN